MKQITQSKIPTILSVLLMLILVILQFTPYWSFDGQSASIGSYVWFPADQGDLANYIEGAIGEEPDLNNFVGTPILILVVGILGAIFYIWKPDLPITPVLSVVFGGMGLQGYLRCSILKLGGLWGLHVALCAAVLILGILSCFASFKAMKDA